MNKNYIIWGISDKGYEDNISSSFPNKIIPAEFKASVSDSHRQYAFAFARENPNDHYFYSIEQVGSDVLYTIYRTNFKGGSVGNRLAYDAATIIISKNHIIEKPLNSLKLLISSYITQKDSGFGNFNFENALAGIRLLANNDKRSISKRYKAGYIKYHSETELSSVLVDKKDKLHNFNKVYFFTRLNLLEQGENKIQDLKDYKAIPIKIINFDAIYYRIFVENNEVNIFGPTFNAYKGEEIKIYKAKGNTPLKVELAKAELTITLKKIEPPKPKPQLTNQDIRRKRKRKEKITKYIALALFSVVILGTLGFVFFDKEIRSIFSGSEEKKETYSKDVVVVEFKDGVFTTTEGDILGHESTLLNYFKAGDFKIAKDSTTYTLSGDTAIMAKKNSEKDKKVDVERLEQLLKDIKTSIDTNVIAKVVKAIERVINYEKIKSKHGLRLGENYWQLQDSILFYSATKSNFLAFEKSLDDHKNLKQSLEDKLPKSIFDNIIEYHEVKPNKPKVKPNKPKVNHTVKTCEVITHKDNLFWGRTSTNLERWSTKTDQGSVTKYDNLTKKASDIINAYRNCGCKKCNKALGDPNLKKVDTFIKESQ